MSGAATGDGGGPHGRSRLGPLCPRGARVAEAVPPSYRSKYSKHLFTQPALLAILCLMRYDDWTYREAEVRLSEHAELRAALGLEEHVPDHTTL